MVAKHSKRLDTNDLYHNNSPYLSNYISPRLLGTPELNFNSSLLRAENQDDPVTPTPFVGEDGKPPSSSISLGPMITLSKGMMYQSAGRTLRYSRKIQTLQPAKVGEESERRRSLQKISFQILISVTWTTPIPIWKT